MNSSRISVPVDLASEAWQSEVADTMADPLAGLERFAALESAAAVARPDLLVAGGFGVCEDCHGPIELDRLEAFPAARRCAACSAASATTRRASLRLAAGTGKGETP